MGKGKRSNAAGSFRVQGIREDPAPDTGMGKGSRSEVAGMTQHAIDLDVASLY